MQMHSGLGRGCPSRDALAKRGGAGRDLVDFRKHVRERRVDPRHDRGRRAKIARERQWLERNVADAAPLRCKEQRQVRVAETVDRLHRIADEEQRAAVAALPTGRQELEQADLRLRSVLELVDEQVLDAPVEREQQLRRRVDAAERATGRETELDEVDASRVGELDFELRREVQQDYA